MRLTGRLPDQSALHGLLHKVRNLGIPVVALHYHISGTHDTHTDPER